jgi:predicted aspartyl protease
VARERFRYLYRNVPILNLRVQADGHPAVEFDGVVDSGATHTVLSLEDAEALGLERTDLIESPGIIVADDTKVPSWVTNVPIRAQVQAELTTGEELEPWGPVFDLHPRFMSSGSPLWGQEDFCASFEYRQQRFLRPAHFELEYWAGRSEGAPKP